MRAFHKQAMIKQQIYENILERRSGTDYSPGIQFEASLVNVDEAKSLTKSNQPEKSYQKQHIWCRSGSTKHLRITTRYLLVGISDRKAKKISQAETKKAEEYAAAGEERKFLAAEAAEEGEEKY